MHLHLNPLGGLAGDMFCAALLHARPELLEDVRCAVAGLAMPVAVRLELTEQEGAIGGKRFRVDPDEPPAHQHHHTAFRDIKALLAAAPLKETVSARALRIFTLLAGAEARVHGVAEESVTFHEVGSWDSIADIVAASVLLDALGVVSASCAPLPLGGGRVQTAHGLLPVPAPATAILLQGLPVTDDGIPGERVTPTGAAILRSLEPVPALPTGAILRHTGMGFGSRRLQGLPNCLQILCLETAAQPDLPWEADRVGTLRFDIDDQSPEDFALALDRLRAVPGVLSVTTTQAIGKQGRPTMGVEMLIRPDRLNAVAEACFRETTTIGVRWGEANRFVLSRRQVKVRVDGAEVEAKQVQRPDGPSAKVESRHLRESSTWQERERLRHQGARLALDTEQDLD